MSVNPGRFIVIWLLLFSSAVMGAGDYSYSLHLSKKSLYLKEPMIVTFDINQTDSSKVMFFDFDLKAGEQFFVHRLEKSVDEGYHARKERYTYLVYPLKSGKLEMKFDLLVRRGNDDLLTTAFTGGRYNVKAVETEDSHEQIPPARIDVKPLPVNADLVGKFKVQRHIERSTVDSYEPLYIDVKVTGTGYVPDLKKIEWQPPVPGVKLFVDKPKISVRYTKEGMSTEALFRYALIAQNDFEIPEIHLQAFDTAEKKSYSIDKEALKVNVRAVDASLLLDKKSIPAPVESPAVALKRFLILFIVFLAGWISAVLTMKLRASFGVRSAGDEWRRKVKSSRDARELMKLLILKDAVKYEAPINELERAIYAKEAIDLKRIKKEVLDEN